MVDTSGRPIIERMMKDKQRAQEIYDVKIKPVVEPQHKGKLLVLDITTEDYIVGRDVDSMEKELRCRPPRRHHTHHQHRPRRAFQLAEPQNCTAQRAQTMIFGHINQDRELVAPVRVLDANDHVRRYEAVLDTGFDGALSLPLYLIQDLGYRQPNPLRWYWLPEGWSRLTHTQEPYSGVGNDGRLGFWNPKARR